MEIVFNELTMTETLKSQFQQVYPYLKLEFYAVTHRPGQGTASRLKIESDCPIGRKFNADHSEERTFTILPDMTTLELEQGIENLFGVGVQVFRKSGSVWLETVATDDWTIREQNTEAELLSRSIEPDQPLDYQEQD